MADVFFDADSLDSTDVVADIVSTLDGTGRICGPAGEQQER